MGNLAIRILYTGWSCVLLAAYPRAAWDIDQAIDPAILKPRGEYYEATVPDTLDLAERAAVAVRALTTFGNPEQDHAPYGQNFLNANPAYLSWFQGGPPNWGSIGESLVMARQMSGSRENLEIDAIFLRGMTKYAEGFIQTSTVPTPASVVMLSLLPIHQLDPQNAELKRIVDELARFHERVGKPSEQGGVYYWDKAPEMDESHIGIIGHGWTPFVQGLAVHALSRWGEVGGDRSWHAFSEKLIEYMRQPMFWEPEGAPKAVVGHEHGQFMGHHHSFLSGLKGLLCFAEATGDVRLMQFVREGYEYFRTFGLARIGLFGEGCSTGDMVFLAIKLSDLGVGDYYEDADMYVRNHLVELQLNDVELLHRVVGEMPAGRGKSDMKGNQPFDADSDSTDSAVERSIGAFLSDSTHPAKVPEKALLYTICCTGNCIPALYAAWEATVRGSGDTAQINLLLNRSSPWLDLDSWIPYEGKVAIHNKKARRISVRMPLWVDTDRIVAVNGEVSIELNFVGRYLLIDDLKPGDQITIDFPMAETTETWTLKWKQTDFWSESTNPGNRWKPLDEPDRYTLTLLGNTVVDIAPRPEGFGYPLYQRENMKSMTAPMKKTTRYVAPVTFAW